MEKLYVLCTFIMQSVSVIQSINKYTEFFLSNHPNQRSADSGKSPTKSDDGQAEEGAEGGVERLDLG